MSKGRITILSMRIASLSPAATEILFALGIGHQIVCTDQFSNFPEEAKAIPHLRDMVRIDPEALREFRPDAVFLGTSIQKHLADLLRSQGFPVIYDDPRTLEQIYLWIRSMGTIVAREKEAVALIAQMKRGFQDIEKRARVMRNGRDATVLRLNIDGRRDATPLRLYIEEWPALLGNSGKHNPPYASGNWVPEIARIAGGQQFPVTDGALSPVVSLEDVSRWDPDLIVISWCGAGTTSEKRLLTERPGWSDLRAIHQGNVRVIDDSLLNRPGPRLVEGAQRLYGWIFEMLH